MILQKRLAKDGHEVVAVVHGGDAMRLLEKDQAWDLVLMDLMMPVSPIAPFPAVPTELTSSRRRLWEDSRPPRRSESEKLQHHSLTLSFALPPFLTVDYQSSPFPPRCQSPTEVRSWTPDSVSSPFRREVQL